MELLCSKSSNTSCAAERLLTEVSRVLKQDRFLILSTPNFAYWLNRLRILFGGLSHDEGYHYRFFTPSVLKQRLGAAGFQVQHASNTMPAIGYNFVFNRILGLPRRHVHVPNLLSPFLAYTLIVRSVKSKNRVPPICI